MKQLNILGQHFSDSLKAVAAQNDAAMSARDEAQKVHVTGAGGTLTFAYEQLRNAAEYADDDLLQYAIKRFYKRLFLTRDNAVIKDSGEELVIELTLAGYLKNDTITVDILKDINKLAVEHHEAYLHYGREAWTLDVLAYEVEQLFVGNLKRDAFAQFAFDYFLSNLNQKKILGHETSNYEILLFIAVHKGLIKSNNACIRAHLLHRYQQKPGSAAYEHTNKMIDSVIESPAADKLYHIVHRRSASLRILWRMVDDGENFPKLLESRDTFLSIYKSKVANEYKSVTKRINRGIVKSVVFLIITKTLIGVAIEVPYDQLIHGGIIWLPLIINLIFPPVYMILLRFTLQLPGSANSKGLIDSIDDILYGDNSLVTVTKQAVDNRSTVFNVAYSIFSLAVVVWVTMWLVTLQFDALHLLIFFIFVSAASFLGFRLSRQIRELEVVDAQQSFISMFRDFVYLPFVAIGQWVSEKYAKINIVALALDMVIELPLKTILRLIRQWGNFINNKKDSL